MYLILLEMHNLLNCFPGNHNDVEGGRGRRAFVNLTISANSSDSDEENRK